MTIVQAVVAAAILAITVGSSLAGLLQARFMARAAAHRVHALQICRSNLEALRYSSGYADPALSVGTHTNMPSDVPQVLSVGGRILAVAYTPVYTVVETDLGYGARYKTVGMDVTWEEPGLGGTRGMECDMNTVIAAVLDR